jgi:hypothetical protein
MTDDDVARNPAVEAHLDEVWRLAREDARADRDPQILTGILAAYQDEYDDRYSSELVKIAAEKESS